MGALAWLVYILSFFAPPFGFITFWVFTGRRDDDLAGIARGSLIASFIGFVVWMIVAATGATLGFLGMGMGWVR